MTEPNESHDELRAALTRAYGAPGNPNDEATADRVLRAFRRGEPARRLRLWSLSAVSAVALVGVWLVIVVTMLSIPRGAPPAGQARAGANVVSPSPRPAPIRTSTSMHWSLGLIFEPDKIRFDFAGLTPNAKLRLVVVQGAATGESTMTIDSDGGAHLTMPAPPNLLQQPLSYNVCVTPVGGTESCSGAILIEAPHCNASGAPSPTTSGAATCTCPPGTRQTNPSTPPPTGSYWIDCLGTTRVP